MKKYVAALVAITLGAVSLTNAAASASDRFWIKPDEKYIEPPRIEPWPDPLPDPKPWTPDCDPRFCDPVEPELIQISFGSSGAVCALYCIPPSRLKAPCKCVHDETEPLIIEAA